MSGVRVDAGTFLMMNAVFAIVMTAAVAASRRTRAAEWILATLGTATLLNGLLHLGATVATRSYSPGLWTGVALWLPLGSFALQWTRRRLPAGAFRLACLGGLALQALAPLILLTVRR